MASDYLLHIFIQFVYVLKFCPDTLKLTFLKELPNSFELFTTPTFIFELIHHMPNGPMTSLRNIYSCAGAEGYLKTRKAIDIGICV